MPAQQREDRACLILRARDEDPPAEERLHLEPVELLALGDHIADDDDARAGLLRALRDRTDVTERAGKCPLIDGGATASDGDRGLGVCAHRHELARDLGGTISAVEEDDRDAGMHELIPDKLGVVSIDDPKLTGATSGEPETGVCGDTGDVAHARSDLEGDLCLAECGGFVQERAIDDRVTRDQADDLLALSGCFDDDLHPVRMVERDTVSPHGDHDFCSGLGVRLCNAHDVGINDDHFGTADEGDSSHGEQVRVAGARRDEGNRTGSDLATRFRVHGGGACGHGYLS
ncbi:unannotated protein [freshwater metagenome]|uniref:Unannotated protein n=1 Tax=freshwater metagenome TaxID=449393 RepID=A0A6J6TA32_9ZZZZ